METASLRIKFTPLLNDGLKDHSKCCLEIVPEVSCIENFENIEWEQKNDFIEYTIPMTYKVIIKKQQFTKESTSDNLEKIYHSCVDLLAPSSITALELSSGDMTRMTSDTYIHNNILTNDKVYVKNNTFDSIINVKDMLQNKRYSNMNTVDQSSIEATKNIQKQLNNITKVDASTSQIEMIDTNNIDHNFNNYVSNSNIELHLCKDNKSESVETITEILTDSNKEGSLRKLSLTPIYSINTNENLTTNTNSAVLWDSVMYHMFEPQYEAVRIKDISLDRDPKSSSGEIVKVLDSDVVEKVVYKKYKRELPEIRVAKFVKIMEQEILPLKIMLRDIISKCSSLGLTNNKKYNFNSKTIMYNKNSYNNKQISNDEKMMIKYCKIQPETERQSKCNRVVYSVVFDG